MPFYHRLSTLGSLIGATTLLATGCGNADYIGRVVGGQLRIYLESQPVEQVLASNTLTDVQAERLRLILDVRQFGIDELGLFAGDSYTFFFDTKGQPPAYNVSASHKDRFESVTWTFPFVGEVPYLGFFDPDEADALEATLIADGFDVRQVEVAAYSTLGILPDPIFSSMLDFHEVSLADLILHEMTHNTVFRDGDTDFNESLATFIGRTGAMAFLESQDDIDPLFLPAAIDGYEDLDRWNAFLASLYESLEAFYASDLSSADKIAGRQRVYEEAMTRFKEEALDEFHRSQRFESALEPEINNAWLLSNRRYNLDLALFAEVFEATGEDFKASIVVFQDASNADDAKAFLRDWIAANAPDSVDP
jgi:predicted aminopeptidase